MAKPSRTAPRSTSPKGKQHADSQSGRPSGRSAAPRAAKQSGSTFLGIVLGLIVGLAIAVVVALYITRAPTPFVAKVAPGGASEAGTIEQQYDPNRALQGKSPGQPVPQAAQQTPPPNTAPGQSSGQPATPAQAPGLLQEPQIVEVPSANGASNAAANAASAPAQQQPAQANGQNPAQQKKPAQTANAAPAVTPNANNAAHPAAGANDANTGYFLQVGAYKTAADAEQQRARLAFQGFESKVSQRDAGGVTYFRVRIGPFSKFDEMNATRQRLSDAGIDTAVIRFTKQ
ncbi:cell division protein [Trinickia dabaoshanensis]|uniref:Cell division protein n=1 Tax=Trinickia dabaoshanensis TaxID=564714 RepID=A0A2N7VSA4_9BURK|nr:SPOR domain-containing protein [Trinickia dabaoshanensis]PMS20012.1 cell division protein [Trinickia dabaoshanensis]